MRQQILIASLILLGGLCHGDNTFVTNACNEVTQTPSKVNEIAFVKIGSYSKHKYVIFSRFFNI